MPSSPPPAAPSLARSAPDPSTAPPVASCPVYSSATLFGPAQEIHIEHQSQVYRLRRTALGKLILTK